MLTKKAETIIEDIDPTNSLSFMRIKSRNCEYMVIPGDDFYVMSVQVEDITPKVIEKK